MGKKKKSQKEIGYGEELLWLETGSDLELALYSVALLDVYLGKIIEQFLIDDEREVKELMSRGLGDFAPKIRLAYLLGLISEEEKNDLNLIREIRNEFAHQLDRPLALEGFKDKIERLEISRQFMAHPACLIKGSLRDQFKRTIYILRRYLLDRIIGRSVTERRIKHPPFKYLTQDEMWPPVEE